MTAEGCACKAARETTPVNCSRFESGNALDWSAVSSLVAVWVMTLEWGTSQSLELWKWCLNNRGDEQTVKKKVYWHTYYCLRCRVQNSLKSSDQVTRRPWTLPPTPPFSKHLFWATASLCVPRWEVQELTVARRWRLWLYVVWRLLHRTDPRILWQPVRKTEAVVSAEPATRKQQKKEETVTVDRS